MPLPAKHSRPLSLAERVSRALNKADAPPSIASPGSTGSTCLLLDVSGSMAEDCEPGRSKIQALREIVPTLRCAAVYAFSDRAQKCAAIPEPAGQTMMSAGFARAKCDGHTGVVLITDGLPSEPETDVIRAAAGLRVEIFYVGPAPKPDLLDRLSRAGKGQAHQTSLRKDAGKLLATKLAGLLGPGE